MTIPTLMSKYKEHVTVTKLKKAQSVLANAFKMHVAENGKPNLTCAASSTINGITTCMGYHEESITIEQIKPYIKGEIINNIGWSGNNLLIADDGIVYGFHTNYQISVTTDNFDKTKDQFSQKQETTFWFTYHDGKIIPGAYMNSDNLSLDDTITANSVCPKDNSPYAGNCTYWALRTGKLYKKAGEWFE